MKHDAKGNGVVSQADRDRWVARSRATGMGLKRFAAEHGLRPGQLHHWVYAPPSGPATGAEARVFIEVRLTGGMASPAGWAAEIGLSNGTTVWLRELEATDVADLIHWSAITRPCSERAGLLYLSLRPGEDELEQVRTLCALLPEWTGSR